MNQTTKVKYDLNLNFTNNSIGYLSRLEYDNNIQAYNNNTLKETTKEKLIINPKIAYEVTSKMIFNSVPKDIGSYSDLYGKVHHFSKSSPVENLLWDYLYFVDSDLFKPTAHIFNKSLRSGGIKKASYCSYPKGTTAYKKFWKNEFVRCKKGYEPEIDGKPCGLRISGEFYFYLNYGRINKIVEQEDGSTTSIVGFPDFLSMDYYYYRELEARDTPAQFGLPNEYKQALILTKSRRKGFSYKAAVSSVWIIAFNNNVKVGIASAPDTYKTDAALAAKKSVSTLDHLTNYTPFGRKDVGDVKSNGGWKNEVASITDLKVNLTLGIFNTRTREKRGRQSSIVTMSLNKDDAASGEGLMRLYFEEAGKSSNLNKAWGFARESMKAGSLYRGLGIIFGCFVGDTIVFNNKGVGLKIKDLNVNDGIIGFSSKTLMNQKINGINNPIEKECVIVKTQYGSMTCSADHPMLVTYSDNRNNNYSKDESNYDPKSHIRNYRALSCWYERAENLTKDHALLIPDLSINNSMTFGDEVLAKNISHQDNDILLNIIEYIKEYKKLPDEVWKLNKKSTWSFISALFDLFGSGDIYQTDIDHKGTLIVYRLFIDKINSYKTTFTKKEKIDLSKSIKMLMYKVGILAMTKGDDQIINSLCKGTFKKFYDEMTDDDLYISNPHEVLTLFIENTHFQNIELRNVSNDFVPNMLSEKLSRKVNILENTSLFEYYKFPEVLYFDKQRTVKTNDMFSEHIRSIYKFKVIGKVKKLKEKQTVYNLNCSPNHNYIADGFIAGNTGGEMVSDAGNIGRSKAFASLFNNPEANDLAAFDNIYDYQNTGIKCGYFVSDMWANFGAKVIMKGDVYHAMDKQGNAFFWVAELALNKERVSKMPPLGTQKDYNLFLTQRCKTPSEAFFATKGSVFNTADLIGVQSRIESSTYGFAKYYKVGELEENAEGVVTFIPDLEDKLQPIMSLNYDNNNTEGALLIYEQPKTLEGNVPKDAYIISCDPIGQDNEGGTSLVSIVVMKTPVYSAYEGFGYERIVATYIGRKRYNPMTYARNLLLRLSKFYNAKITYENDRDGGILQDFTTKGELNRLLPSPELVMSKHLPNSTTRLRKFGHSMATKHHKALGEILLNEWLDYRHPTIKGLNYKDEYVEKIGPRNMDLLQDQMGLEQLIGYNRKGNFDFVMTLMGGIIQMKELYDVDLLETQERTKKNSKSVKRWMNKVLNQDEYNSGGYNYIDLSQ